MNPFLNYHNPYHGTYQIIDKGNPSVVHSTHTISSKNEFNTLFDQVFKYNNALPENGKPRQLVLIHYN